MEKKIRKAGKSARGNRSKNIDNQTHRAAQKRNVETQCCNYFFLLSPSVKMEIINDF